MNLTWQFPGKFLNTCSVWENKMQGKENGSLQTDPTVNSELMKASHTSIEDCMQPPPLMNIKCCLSVILQLYQLHFSQKRDYKNNYEQQLLKTRNAKQY